MQLHCARIGARDRRGFVSCRPVFSVIADDRPRARAGSEEYQSPAIALHIPQPVIARIHRNICNPFKGQSIPADCMVPIPTTFQLASSLFISHLFRGAVIRNN